MMIDCDFWRFQQILSLNEHWCLLSSLNIWRIQRNVVLRRVKKRLSKWLPSRYCSHYNLVPPFVFNSRRIKREKVLWKSVLQQERRFWLTGFPRSNLASFWDHLLQTFVMSYRLEQPRIKVWHLWILIQRVSWKPQMARSLVSNLNAGLTPSICLNFRSDVSLAEGRHEKVPLVQMVFKKHFEF